MVSKVRKPTHWLESFGSSKFPFPAFFPPVLFFLLFLVRSRFRPMEISASVFLFGSRSLHLYSAFPLLDKTAAFSDQIEVHQQELQPWTAKISDKQAAVDVAMSERQLLEKKATGMRDAITEAEEALEKLKDAGEIKVCFPQNRTK